MKATRLFLFLLPVFVISCGGGSGGNQDTAAVAPLEDAPPVVATPVAPDPVVTAPVTEPEPVVINDDTNQIIDPGRLSQFYGDVLFSYTFTGGNSVIVAETIFDASNLVLADNGSVILASVAQTFFRLSDNDPLDSTGSLILGCIEVEGSLQTLCVLDSGGERETLFLLDEVVDVLGPIGALGTFEFCSDNGALDCPSELAAFPDGDVVVSISEPSAIFSGTSNRIDALPYLQYYEQGSISAPKETRKRAKNDAIEKAVAEIRSSAE